MTEPGQPNAAILELAFWEAITRCVQDDDVPLEVVAAAADEGHGICFGNRMPPELWRYMEAALNDLRAAAGFSVGGSP